MPIFRPIQNEANLFPDDRTKAPAIQLNRTSELSSIFIVVMQEVNLTPEISQRLCSRECQRRHLLRKRRSGHERKKYGETNKERRIKRKKERECINNRKEDSAKPLICMKWKYF